MLRVMSASAYLDSLFGLWNYKQVDIICFHVCKNKTYVDIDIIFFNILDNELLDRSKPTLSLLRLDYMVSSSKGLISKFWDDEEQCQ